LYKHKKTISLYDNMMRLVFEYKFKRLNTNNLPFNKLLFFPVFFVTSYLFKSYLFTRSLYYKLTFLHITFVTSIFVTSYLCEQVTFVTSYLCVQVKCEFKFRRNFRFADGSTRSSILKKKLKKNNFKREGQTDKCR
jgi:hypothetical protein